MLWTTGKWNNYDFRLWKILFRHCNPTSANKLIFYDYHWYHSRWQIFQPLFVVNKKLRIGCFFLPFSINVCSFTVNNQRGFLLLNWTYTSRQISDDLFTHWVCKRSIFKTHLSQIKWRARWQVKTPANEQAANEYNTRADHHSLPIKS